MAHVPHGPTFMGRAHLSEVDRWSRPGGLTTVGSAAELEGRSMGDSPCLIPAFGAVEMRELLGTAITLDLSRESASVLVTTTTVLVGTTIAVAGSTILLAGTTVVVAETTEADLHITLHRLTWIGAWARNTRMTIPAKMTTVAHDMTPGCSTAVPGTAPKIETVAECLALRQQRTAVDRRISKNPGP